MLDTSFPHDYKAEFLAELPIVPARRWYYPGGTEAGGANGLIVRVSATDGEPWIGIFAFGRVSRSGVSGLYTSPRSGWMCVVSLGQGYLVNASDPRATETVHLTPVLGVLPAPSRNLLVFHDFTRLAAVGEAGVAWETPSLSWDGLSEVRVAGETVSGEGWDAPHDQWVSFEVALDSGRHRGGSSPELLREGSGKRQ